MIAVTAADFLERHGETGASYTTADYEGLEHFIEMDHLADLRARFAPTRWQRIIRSLRRAFRLAA